MLFVFVSIFLFTAVLGRLWCGWACPQTVYLEFLYRPLQRLFEGTVGKGGAVRSLSPIRKIGYFAAALLVTALPAHTFLAYFVGVDQLSQYMRQSPLEHSTAFIVMLVVTGLMFFDFYWFREQLCLIACPYGRFQSVLLDRQSLIVSYDRNRGEPRGKTHALPVLKTANAVVDASPSRAGDCVDCHLCVTTCPTGIDIREGLQMECVNCTQCIDACDGVMEKMNRPRGLIRYSSQAAIEGEKRGFMRFRVLFYPAILFVLATGWILIFMGKGTADVTVLRNAGNPYSMLPSGEVADTLKIKITNRLETMARYKFELTDLPEGRIDTAENPLAIAGGQSTTAGVMVAVPPSAFQMGTREAHLRISDGEGFSTVVLLRLLGPSFVAPEEKASSEHDTKENK